MSLIFSENDIQVIYAPLDIFSERISLFILEKSNIFPSELIEYLHKCRSSERRRELIVSRLLFLYLMKKRAVNIRYYDSIKEEDETLMNCFYISSDRTAFASISHSKKNLAVALNLNSTISIDIEPLGRQVGKIDLFFTNKRKIDCKNINSSKKLLLWTIYEALYKIDAPERIYTLAMNQLLLEVELNKQRNEDKIIYYFFIVGNYRIFVWRDLSFQICGSLIFTREDKKKIKFYMAMPRNSQEEKPCNIRLTRLLNINKISEIII